MRIAGPIASLIFVSLIPGAATAQEKDAYPSKIIRILTAATGSNNDIGARVLAQELTPALGQRVIVDNRATPINIETVAKSPPDGHTLLVLGPVVWVQPFLRDDVAWDPVKDFAPVTLAVVTPNVIVVHPSLPVKSVKELIALAKARPGELNYASAAMGTTPHLAAELFNSLAGIKTVFVGYKGSGPAMVALLSGQVHLQFPSLGSITPHMKSGRVRALAITTAKPSPLAPELPTAAASGLPGYESVSQMGVLAPAKTPARIIAMLNRETVRILNRPEVRDRFFSTGSETVGNSPEEFSALIRTEMVRWGKVIKDAGIRGPGGE
jgi:tripartite-type tricarboxylate transporter receptor subunit TctC